MADLRLSPQVNTLPLRRLRIVVFIGLTVIVLMWWHIHFTTLQVKNNPNTEPDLALSKAAAQPVLEALEKYRSDNGLYPAMLDQLTPTYVSTASEVHGYRYSARHGDWVFKSASCAAREKNLRGWILKQAKPYQKEVAQYKLDCISGYGAYQLQSPDFPQDQQSLYIERWAYYDSQPKQWSVGWCSHQPGSRGKGQELGINGVCRWRHSGRAAAELDPW